MFRNMPFILFIIILLAICVEPLLPLLIKEILYSISLTIKSIIILFLPIIIFCLLFKAMIILNNQATKFLSIILVLVCVSNYISTFLSHFVGEWVYKLDLSMITPKATLSLNHLWSLNIPALIANDTAMLGGIIIGIIASKLFKDISLKVAGKIDIFTNYFFKTLIYVIPLFVAGFIIKLQHESLMMIIFKDYSIILLIIAIAQFSYISLLYFIFNNCKISNFLISIKNMLPACISGFSTMSSAASMPLTIIGVGNNAKNKSLANSIVPTTVNIHLIGDCFAIPILAYAVLKSFDIAEPNLLNFLIFSFYFVLAKFSVAAVPGGGILVMLPILQEYLGFNGDMMSLITALYILFDPVITSANVLGNGVFAKMAEKCMGLFDKKNVLE